MRFTAAVALFAGLVAAQTTTTTGAASTSTDCPAQPIVESCLTSTQARLATCTPNDWTCMCAAQEAVVTCYNNCPNDPRASSANSTKIQYCQAAAQQSPSSSASKASTTSAASSSTGSRTSTSATASSTNNAGAAIGASGSGLFAVAVGVAALI